MPADWHFLNWGYEAFDSDLYAKYVADSIAITLEESLNEALRQTSSNLSTVSTTDDELQKRKLALEKEREVMKSIKPSKYYIIIDKYRAKNKMGALAIGINEYKFDTLMNIVGVRDLESDN